MAEIPAREKLLADAGHGWKEHRPAVEDADCPSCDTGYCRPHMIVVCGSRYCGDEWPCYPVQAYRDGIAAGRDAAAIDVEDEAKFLAGDWDDLWKYLEQRAVNADWPAGYVRRRRTRDDFTTITIQVACEYGYERAKKLARGTDV